MNKQQRGLETMDRVLDAALDCFVARGIHATRIEDLSQQAEVSVGSLYHHFGGRDRVAFLLYKRCMESLLNAVAAAAIRRKTAREGVHALVRGYLSWVEAHPEQARFIYAAGGQAALFQPWRAEMLAWKQELVLPFVAWFQAHIDVGTIVALPPALMEVVVIGPAAEFARRWLDQGPGLEMRAAMKSLPEAVWRSIAA